jgi:hypothetical protein
MGRRKRMLIQSGGATAEKEVDTGATPGHCMSGLFYSIVGLFYYSKSEE